MASLANDVLVIGRTHLIHKLWRACSLTPRASSVLSPCGGGVLRTVTLTTYRSYCVAAHQIASSSPQGHLNAEVTGQHIPALPQEHRSLMQQEVRSPPDARILHVAIIGAPNAGKSTLANKLLGWKFATVSKKVHTTRQKTVGVLTEENTQIVFVDTPGMIGPGKVKRFELERTLLTDPHMALPGADLMLVVVDCAHIWHHTRLDEEILKVLHLNRNTPSVLVLNKVDCLKSKRHLLNITNNLTEGVVAGQAICHSVCEEAEGNKEELFEKVAHIHRSRRADSLDTMSNSHEQSFPGSGNTHHLESVEHEDSLHKEVGERCTDGLVSPADWKAYHEQLRRVGRQVKRQNGWGGFSRVFMVSALTGDGVDDVKDFLYEQAKPGAWDYPAQLVSQQDPRQLACLCLREKLLDHLPSEIPYTIKINVTLWQEDEGLLRTEFDLICKSKRHYGTLLGKHGSTVQIISSEVKQDLMNIFRREMTLRLRVVASGKWKNRPSKKHIDHDEDEEETDD